jgi:hypothetical protein
MDGCCWKHYFGPSPGWREKVHGATPGPLQAYLPATWCPPPPNHLDSLINAGAEAMKWRITGPFDNRKWRLTWVDCNGFESEGHAGRIWSPPGRPVSISESLPPCHSPEVILRVRERTLGKPLTQWPILAELPMRNPSLVPESGDPVDQLPATRTQDDLALTLQSLTVDPTAEETSLVEVRIKLPAGEPVADWESDVQFFDQRRMTVGSKAFRFTTDRGDLLIHTTACLWSDAPWHVRVSLRPRRDLPPRVSDQIRFTGVRLPGTGPVLQPSDHAGTAGGSHVQLTRIQPGTVRGQWILEFLRSALPGDHRFGIRSATDDLGRPLTWNGGTRVEMLSNNQVRSSHTLSGPDDTRASMLDVVVGVDEPLVYDFCVMPEFKRGAVVP